MALRSHAVVADALLDFLYAEGKSVRPRDTYDPLARVFHLTKQERAQALTSRDGSAWDNLVQWARQRLVKRGLLDGSMRGAWSLTVAGRNVAQQRASEAQAFASPDYMHDGVESFIEAEEGRRILRIHLIRERSNTLVEAFKNSLLDFSCTACGFDFFDAYGELGRGYIEAHHTVPISTLRPGDKTRLRDLVAVCANCHRIIHRNSLISVTELQHHLHRPQ